jgi:hypothetical protein
MTQIKLMNKGVSVTIFTRETTITAETDQCFAQAPSSGLDWDCHRTTINSFAKSHHFSFGNF